MPAQDYEQHTPEIDAYADEAPITELLGGSARVRIISALTAERQHDLSITEIAHYAGVARSTVYHHLEELQDLGVITHTRTSGASERYQLANTQLADTLYQLDGLALQQLLTIEQ